MIREERKKIKRQVCTSWCVTANEYCKSVSLQLLIAQTDNEYCKSVSLQLLIAQTDYLQIPVVAVPAASAYAIYS